MKIPFNNQMVDAEEIDPIAAKEDWNEYQMPNGEVLMVKVVLVRALRATATTTPDGTPLYSINTQPILKVKPAPEKK